MIKLRFNGKTAIALLLALTGFITLFHVAVLVKLIPYEIAWGGRLHSVKEMYLFEALSILLNLFLGFILLIKGLGIKTFVPRKKVNLILWAYFFLFALNTVGNMLAKSTMEKSFTFITLLAAWLLWTILMRGSKYS